MFGNAFYQDGKFKCDDNITILKNNNFSKNIYLFLTSRLNILNKKYSYGNQLRPNRLSRDKILLPIDSKGNPNWQFMEDYVKQEMRKQSQKIIRYYENKLLKLAFELLDLEVEWKEFKIKDIFEVYTGRDIIISKLKEGKYPVVTHSLENNGIQFFSSKIENRRLFNHKTTISLADRGNFVAYVHPNDFYIGTRVKALSLKEEKDSYILHFLTIVINNQRVRFSYGYNATNKVADMKIMLPTDKNGNPHWEYMGKFVKNLEKENIEKVLEYIYIYIT